MKKALLFALILALMAATMAHGESVAVKNIECPGGSFINESGKIMCLTCQPSFAPQNNTCKPKTAKDLNTQTPNNPLERFGKFIDDKGAEIMPDNPGLGRIILLIITIGILTFAAGLLKNTLTGKAQVK